MMGTSPKTQNMQLSGMPLTLTDDNSLINCATKPGTEITIVQSHIKHALVG